MSDRIVQQLKRYVCQAAEDAALQADSDLLRQFIEANDHRAFEVLLERHGPMVLGTARRLVNNYTDADDVFQAVFLSLARLAKSIRQGQSVPNWLYTTTCRIADRVRKRRVASSENTVEPNAAATVETDLAWHEVRTALDEELQRLPERLRSPLLLCYFSGLTRDEAAVRLGWSLGTLKRRLEEGRTTLRRRLEHRGISSAGVALAVLSPSALNATVRPALAQLCLDAVSRKVTADRVSALILTTTTTFKGIVMKAVIVSLAFVGLGVGIYAGVGRADPASPASVKTSVEPPPPGPTKASSPQKAVTEDDDRSVAEWVIANGGSIRTSAGTFGKGDPLGDGPFQITAISLGSTHKVKDDDVARFKNLTKLNNLSLANTPVGDAGLKHLAGLKSLESLYLPNTEVGDAGLAHLKEMTGLVNLYLDGTKVTNTGLEHLTSMKRLSVLYLRQTPITDAGLKHLKAMPQLCWVDLWGTKVTDTGVKDLQVSLPKCTVKNVDPKNDSPPPPADAQAVAIAALEKTGGRIFRDKQNTVYEVYLVGPKVNDTSLLYVKALPDVLTVTIYDSEVTDAGLAHLKGMKNLTTLWIEKSKISDAGLKHVMDMPKLSQLHVRFMPLTDKGLEHLKDLTSLTTLDLDSANITDAGVEHLKGLTNLTALDLSRTRVTDACVPHLKGMTKLENLSLHDTTVSDVGLEQLEGLTKLKFLILKLTKVTEAGVKKFQQALPKCEIATP